MINCSCLFLFVPRNFSSLKMNLLFSANKSTVVEMLIYLGGHVSVFIKKRERREKKCTDTYINLYYHQSKALVDT